MGKAAQPWLEKLGLTSLYDQFDYQNIPSDLQGWSSHHPIFEQLIDEIQPRLILEVGTWKGASALHMASLLRQRAIDSVLICIDTWLGGLEHILQLEEQPPELYYSRSHGYPTLYYQFLANVLHSGLQDYIVPFPNTSSIAARWLFYYNVQADLVYIDASHDADDVYSDLVNYWDLLRIHGVMFGDDWRAEWHGVISAVTRFAREKEGVANLELAGDKWVLRKLPTPTEVKLAEVSQRLRAIEQFLQEVTSFWDPHSNQPHEP